MTALAGAAKQEKEKPKPTRRCDLKPRRKPTVNATVLAESKKRKLEAEKAEVDRRYNVAQNRLEEYTRQRLRMEREKEAEARREAEAEKEAAKAASKVAKELGVDVDWS